MKLVSILVPCYNASPYLRECIQSALAQTYKRCEIIVVDDGSTDGSGEVARAFECDRLQVMTQHNQGQPSALNAAMRVAQGDYLQFLDADDVLDARKIERQVSRLSDADSTAIASGRWGRFRETIADARFVPEPVWRDLDPVDWVVESWSGGGMMPLHGWLIPREVALIAGEWDESVRWAPNVDALFFTKALLAASRCVFCREAVSYYRSPLGAKTQRTMHTRQALDVTLRIIVETGIALLRMEESLRTRRAYADNLQRFAYMAYPSAPDLVAKAEHIIVDLGGSSLRWQGGPSVTLLSRVVGWRVATRARIALGRLRQWSGPGRAS